MRHLGWTWTDVTRTNLFIHVHVHDPIASVDGVSGIGIGSDVIDLDYSTSGLQKGADVGWKLVVLVFQHHVAGPRCDLHSHGNTE